MNDLTAAIPDDVGTALFASGVIPLGMDSKAAHLKQQYEKVDREMLLREVVHNAMDAGASEIQISVSSTGSLLIRDNGHGMSPEKLLHLIGGWARSTRNIGIGGDHFGHGLKGCARGFDASIAITSSEDGQLAGKMLLAPGNNGEWGIVEHGCGSAVAEVSLNSTDFLYGKTGTVVEILDVPGYMKKFRNPEAIAKFLNARYLNPRDTIKIYTSPDFTGEQLAVPGLLGHLRQVSKKDEGGNPLCGFVELEHCNLYWGTRREDLGRNDPSVDAIHFAWDGEVYHSKSVRGGMEMLSTWGVRAGASSVIMIIEAKGPDIQTDITRFGSFKGWEKNDARVEVRENLPEQLRAYIDEQIKKRFDGGADDALVQRFLDWVGAPDARLPLVAIAGGPGNTQTLVEGEDGTNVPKPIRSLRPTKGGGGGKGGGGKPTGPKTNTGGPKTNTDEPTGEVQPAGTLTAPGVGDEKGKSTGIFPIAFAGREEFETELQPCRIMEAPLAVVINRDCPHIAALLEQAIDHVNAEERHHVVRALIQEQVIGGVNAHYNLTGKLPSSEELGVILGHMPLVNAYLLGRFALPAWKV